MENNNSESKCTIKPTSRTVIENKLLARLEEKGTVAILANEQDLHLMIAALGVYAKTTYSEALRQKALEMAADFEKLHSAAFP
jgi:hypothetical protein